MLKDVSDSLAIDLGKVSVIRFSNSEDSSGKAIVLIEGSEFTTDIDFDLMKQLVNDHQDRVKKLQSLLSVTTDSQFAG